MRILMTTDNIGGVWTYSIDLARGLRKFGIEVILAILGDPLTKDQREELEGIPYYHAEFKQEWMDNPWRDIRLAGQWLLVLNNVLRPDIVHLNSYAFAGLRWRIPVVVTLHSCVMTWWEAVKREKAPERWNAYKELVKNGIRAANVVVAPSNTMLELSEKYYGTIKRKVVIYNGRNAADFSGKPKEKIIFTMGKLWDEAKNCIAIIDAADKINYPIYIAGSEAPRLATTISPNVNFLGHLSSKEISEWLSRAAVYLLPAHYEPFGYSFLDAALSHCTLVGGDIALLHEIWGPAMIYLNRDQPDKMPGIINLLMEDEDLREEFSNEAYQKAVSMYSLDRMISQYAKLYYSVHRYKKDLIIS